MNANEYECLVLCHRGRGSYAYGGRERRRATGGNHYGRVAHDLTKFQREGEDGMGHDMHLKTNLITSRVELTHLVTFSNDHKGFGVGHTHRGNNKTVT
jgi:hypothetical protein